MRHTDNVSLGILQDSMQKELMQDSDFVGIVFRCQFDCVKSSHKFKNQRGWISRINISFLFSEFDKLHIQFILQISNTVRQQFHEIIV